MRTASTRLLLGAGQGFGRGAPARTSPDVGAIFAVGAGLVNEQFSQRGLGRA